MTPFVKPSGARDVIARTLHDLVDDLGYGMTRCFDMADQQIAALISAPEPVRQEMVALLNPWRPFKDAPRDGTEVLAITDTGIIRVDWFDQKLSSWQWANERGDDRYVKWQNLPAPPSEDKP